MDRVRIEEEKYCHILKVISSNSRTNPTPLGHLTRVVLYIKMIYESVLYLYIVRQTKNILSLNRNDKI